ncbi:MDN1 [Ecytonucleospora hepatopenaei]|uniref:Midasin n=1 Tax=Ecytonucleospora hepatopenaei TaxID=646526 RepID=A0A1W0E5N0_9MICR|nr:MDN1 [Ecytonucleospora hepatopenaei]
MMDITIFKKDSCIDEIKNSLEINYPFVLWGCAGKRSFLESFIKDIIFIDSSEIKDITMLKGFYSFVNGDVVFTKGLLIDAMEQGLKICFTNFDSHVTLQQYLAPVLSNNSLYNYKGEKVEAHKKFRIFFTATDSFSYRNVNFIGPFLNIKNKSQKYFEFNSNPCKYHFNKMCNEICEKKSSNCFCDKLGENFVCDGCFYKDMFYSKLTYGLGINKQDRILKAFAFKNVFLEHNSTKLFEKYYINEEDWNVMGEIDGMVCTKFLNEIMVSIELNIKNRVCTLLVGETGGGKTSFLQGLSKKHKVELKIINISSDVDCFDLIGGFKPVNIEKKIMELAKLVGSTSKDLDSIKPFLNKKEHYEMFNEIKMYKKHKISFEFKEGLITNAMANGHWLLLDEINLLDLEGIRLIDNIAKKQKYFYNFESNSKIKIHENFRMFACMNPSGDFGKKEIDLKNFLRLNYDDFISNEIEIKIMANMLIDFEDEFGYKEAFAQYFYELKQQIYYKKVCNLLEPLLTGRTFKRICNFINAQKGSNVTLVDAIYTACHLFIFTQFNLSSISVAIDLFKFYFKIDDKNIIILENKVKDFAFSNCLSENVFNTEKIGTYVLTQQVKIVILDILLAIKENIPLLLQGSTASGKTSLLTALGAVLGKRVFRINNFDGTDINDYLGCYKTVNGGFVFMHGPLVKAMINGDWIILDELNLAASDVLEALNRLLDDNREIYIEETGEVIRPHKNFRLFATQNINYQGRKGLAKSFRNRFVEITFLEKSEIDIQKILAGKNLPNGFVKIILAVVSRLNLSIYKNSENLLTIREILKLIHRKNEDYLQLFWNIVELMSFKFEEKYRKNSIEIVYDVFYKNKRIFCSLEQLYKDRKEFIANFLSKYKLETHIVLTDSCKTLIYHIYNAWENCENILLVGETGIGKTFLCKIVSEIIFQKELKILNLSENTDVCELLGTNAIENKQMIWKESFLVKALKKQSCFLFDEINLADSAILERLNSLFESERTIYIPEIDTQHTFQNVRIVATMNPAYSYGKKDLSPAFKNRFTEFCFNIDFDDKISILKATILKSKKLDDSFKRFIDKKLENIEDSLYFLNFIKNSSIRKLTLFIDFIESFWVVKTKKDIENTCDKFINIDFDMNFENLICEGINFINGTITNDVRYNLKVCDKKEKSNFNFVYFDFMQILLRTFTVDMGVLMVGKPGTGKTSVVKDLAVKMQKRMLRINLSENTEIEDLLGSIVPCKNGDFIFKHSFLVSALQDENYFVLFDEINLCSQSVLEGLNSMLDYRKEIVLMTGKAIKIKAKIFGAMNPSATKGRKELPKSFLDRFIVVKAQEYNNHQKLKILEEYVDKNDHKNCMFFNTLKVKFNNENQTKISLRSCIKQILMEKKKKNFEGKIPEYLSQLNDQKEEDFYFCDEEFFCTKDIVFKHHFINTDFVLLHRHIPSLNQLAKCLLNNVPVILKGGIGRKPLVEFVGGLMKKAVYHIYLSKETEIGDIIGRYVKNETEVSETSCFDWKYSDLITYSQSDCIVVLHNAEYVDKSIFDRLTALFEFEKEMVVFESNLEQTNIPVHKDFRIICFSENIELFSEPLLDRCHVILLDKSYDSVDLLKLTNNLDPFFENNKNESMKKLSVINCLELFSKNKVKSEYEDVNIEKFLKFYKVEGIHNYNFIFEKDCKRQTTTNKLQEIKANNNSVVFYKKCIEFSKSEHFKLIEVSMSGFFTNFNEELLSSTGLKKAFFKELSFKKYCEIPSVFDIANRLKSFTVPVKISNLQNKKIKNEDFNEFKVDPIIDYYNDINNLKNKEINEKLYEIDKIYYDFYKYRDCKEQVVNKNGEIELINSKYKKELDSLNVQRNYSDFLQVKKNFVNTKDGYKIIDSNQIIMHRHTINIFKEYFYEMICNTEISFEMENNIINNLSSATLQLLKNNQVRNVTENEYCEVVYKKVLARANSEEDLNLKQSELKLVTVSFIENQKEWDLSPMLLNFVEYDECDLNDAINLQMEMIEPYLHIVDCRRNVIFDYSNVFNYEKKDIYEYELEILKMALENASVFIKPEELYNLWVVELKNNIKNIDDEKIDEIFSNVIHINKFIDKRIILYNENYCWLFYFANNLPCEKLFYSVSVFEFLQQLKMLEIFIKNFDDFCMLFNNQIQKEYYIVYVNWMRLLKAFDITKKDYSIRNKVICKINRAMIKTFSRYFEIISEYRERWGIQPVVNVLDLDISAFVHKNTKEFCIKNIKNEMHNFKIVLQSKDGLNKVKKFTDNVSEYYINNNNLENDRLCKLIHFFNKNAKIIEHSDQIKCLIKEIIDFTDDKTCEYYVCFVYDLIASEKNNYEIIDDEIGQGIKNIDEEIEEASKESDFEDIKEEQINDEYDKNDKIEEKSDAESVANNGEAELDPEKYESECVDGMIDGEESKEEQDDMHDDKYNEDLNYGENSVLGEEQSNDHSEEEEEEEVINDEFSNNSDVNTIESNVSDNLTEKSNSGKEQKSAMEYLFDTNKFEKMSVNQTCNTKDEVDDFLKLKNESGVNNKLEENEEGEFFVQTEETKNRIDDEKNEAEKITTGMKRLKIDTSITKNCMGLINSIKRVMDANKHSKYKGYYKNGKKISIKALVKYIASNYTKDRIWMKREKNKYDYSFNLYVDNSKSMADYGVVSILSNVIYTLNIVFNNLGISFKIYKFGTLTKEIKYGEIEKEFTFDEESTNVDFVIDSTSSFNLILTDGIFNCGKIDNFIALIIDKKNIKNMKKVSVIGSEIIQENYLSTFGMRYRVLEHCDELDKEIIEIIKMFFVINK